MESETDLIKQYHRLKDAIDKIESKGTEIGTIIVDRKRYSFGDEDDDGDAESDVDDAPISVEAQTKITEALDKIVRHKPFAISGHLVISEKQQDEYKLLLKGGKSGGNLLQPDCDALNSAAQKAPFGDLRTHQTVIDASVRSAMEIGTEDWDIVSKNSDAAPVTDADSFPSKSGRTSLKPLLKLRSVVMEEFGKVELVPYKINCYGPGDFFQKHVDTPTDAENMVGTLVIALPSAHKGGDLIIEHAGATFTVDFATMSEHKDKLQWAAFYSDCIHSVQPVTEGTRVTMTYSIVRTSASCYEYLPQYTGDTKRSPVTGKEIAEAVTKITAALRGTDAAKTGFVLSHKYTFKNVESEQLKSVDRVFVDQLRAAGFGVHLLPVVVHISHIYYYDVEGSTRLHRVIALTFTDLQYLMGKVPSPASAAQLGLQSKENPEQVERLVFFDLGGGKILKHDHVEGAEFTGNEMRPDELNTFYFATAAIVTVNK